MFQDRVGQLRKQSKVVLAEAGEDAEADWTMMKVVVAADVARETVVVGGGAVVYSMKFPSSKFKLEVSCCGGA